MNKNIEQLPAMKLVGIIARTSNKDEMNPATAKIGAVMQKFFMEGMQAKIARRRNPGRVLAVYANYEIDEHSEYDYFLGEEVDEFEDVSGCFEVLTISAQTYVKFASDPGRMPDVVIGMWYSIWKMKPPELGGQRAYIADFEVYDERSKDPSNTVIDIYIGIKE